MKKLIVWSFVLVGALAGVVWYFDVNEAGESWSDVVQNLKDDPMGFFMDLIQRSKSRIAEVTSGDARTIAAGIISGFEGFVGHAYKDAVGVWTIGYGHKIVDGDGFEKDESQTISQSDAFALLESDLDAKATCVDSSVTATLTPNQLAACYSFAYNEGCAAFKSSTLLRKINSGDLSGAVDEFSRWVYAGNPKQILQALVDRRAKEADIFASDIPSSDSSEGVPA